MKTLHPLAIVGLVALASFFAFREGSRMASSAEDKQQALVAHNVYFTLNDGSPEAVQKMVAACHKYLAGHEGTVFYAAGPLAADFDRPVNDRDWHVGLHVVFKDKAAHDKYQGHERHLKFIEENKASWKQVRVFDSYVTSGRK
jgi:hypothetical protein